MTRTGLIGLFLLSACGQQAGGDAQGDQPVPPKASAAEAGSAVLPDYLPDYPGSTRVEVPNLGIAGTDSRSGNAVAMETDAMPAEVADFYRARFAEASVPLRADTVQPNGGLLAVGRDGEQGAMLTITRIGEKTRIAIIRRRGAR